MSEEQQKLEEKLVVELPVFLVPIVPSMNKDT